MTDNKEFSSIFNDDFTDLFNPIAMDIEQNADYINKITDVLKGNVSNEEKLQEVQKLVQEILPKLQLKDVEETFLIHVIPFVKTLTVDLFQEIETTLCSAIQKEKSSKDTNVLREFLRVSISVHETLNCILKILLNNERISLSHVNCLPVNVVDILLMTFKHCKISEKLYGNYFEDLKEILTLFKETQNVHSSFLKLFESHTKIDELSESHLVLLNKVLQVLEEIGIVLHNMNLKALTENWKCYMLLIQKHSSVLKSKAFDTSSSINFLLSESANNLTCIKGLDQKSALSSLKLTNFFIRIALHLSDFSRTGLNVRALVAIYSFSPPVLRVKNYSEDLIVQIENLVFTHSDLFLEFLISEPTALEGLCVVNVKEVNCLGLLLLLAKVFRRFPEFKKKEQSVFQYYKIHLLVALLFDAVEECYSELFWDINIPSANNQTLSLYNELSLQCASTILCLTQEQYSSVEVRLLKNCLRNNLWVSLLATDIWCLVLRKKPSTLAYETIGHIISKTESLLMHSFNDRPEVIFLEVLLKRLYKILSDAQKFHLMNKYPPLQSSHIWKVLGLPPLPSNEGLLSTIAEKIVGINLKTVTAPDFDLLCNLLDLLASFPQTSKTSVSSITQFWNFNANIIGKNSLMEVFLKKVCTATSNFITNFSSSEWLLILTKLRDVLRAAEIDLRFQALEVLRSFSRISFGATQERSEIVSLISQIFRLVLLDKNVVIQQHALSVFTDFMNSTPHKEILQCTIEKNAALQAAVTNFTKRNVMGEPPVNKEEYFNLLKNFKFTHQCKYLPRERCENDIDAVVKRIKTDIKLLHRLRGEENVSERNVGNIFKLLSQQFNCTF